MERLSRTLFPFSCAIANKCVLEYQLQCAPVENSATILATVKVVMCWCRHLSVCDQTCALWLLFFMHLVVMIRQDKKLLAISVILTSCS